MDFVLRTRLAGFTIETTVADGQGTMTVHDGSSTYAHAVVSGDPVTQHFVASAALTADPQRIFDPLDTLSATPATFAVESPTPTGVLRTQVSPHGSVTMMTLDGARDPQWISERGPARTAPGEHATVWREVARVVADQAPKAPSVAETASTRRTALPAALPLPVDDPAHIPVGVRAALGLDARRWQCGTDGARWLLWTTGPSGQIETPAVDGRPRIWPSETAVRREAALHGQVVQRAVQPLPPALVDQLGSRAPSVPERSVFNVLS